MTRPALRWTLAAAALTLAACGGSQQTQQSAATPPSVALKSPSPTPRAAAVLPPMTITFNKPTDPNVKAACQAALTGENDPPKNEKVVYGDTVTWNLVKGDCGSAYDPSKVNLHFTMHVFKEGNNLGAPQNTTEITGTVDDMNNTSNGKHKYAIEFDHKDAGDPDIDVNDCGGPPPGIPPASKTQQ